jgi:Uma2 family endonuclease
MASLPNAKPVTYEEWLTMPEVQDAIEEVVNGEIRIMPAPKWNHSEIIDDLADNIKAQVDRRNVRVKVSDFGLIIRRRPLTSRVPDLAVFERSTIVEMDGYIHSAPQLIVEALSPANTQRDIQEKLADYASLGVPEVWHLYPESRAVEVLLLRDAVYHRSQPMTSGLLQPKLFPNVSIDIATIWPD